MALYHNKQAVVALDTSAASADAFGRQRVSEPYTEFESSFIGGGIGYFWSEQTAGSGTITRNIPVSAADMSVYTSGDYAIMQTIQRFIYQKGKSQYIKQTGILGGGTGLSTLIGLVEQDSDSLSDPYFAYNGVYFESINGIYYCTIALNGVFDRVPQTEWNQDTLNGTDDTDQDGNPLNPTRLNVDFTKERIFVIDLQWLGVGIVRMAVDIGGKRYYTHHFEHENLSSVYMRSANLAARYEIRSTGGAGSMQNVCCSIESEGGRQTSGWTRIYKPEAFALPTNGAFTAANLGYTCLCAMRLQQDKPHANIRLLDYQTQTLGTNNSNFLIALVPGTTSISVNGTPTALDNIVFASVDQSSVEFKQFDITGDDTVTHGQIQEYLIHSQPVPDASGGATAIGSVNQGNPNNHVSIGREINGSRWCYLFLAQCYGSETARISIKYNDII